MQSGFVERATPFFEAKQQDKWSYLRTAALLCQLQDVPLSRIRLTALPKAAPGRNAPFVSSPADPFRPQEFYRNYKCDI